MIYRFMGKHAGHAVEKMCHTFSVSCSGYYQWPKRKPSLRDRKDELLKQEILKIYHQGRGNYGSPRVSIATCSKLASAAAENLLNRNFNPRGPNQWLGSGYPPIFIPGKAGSTWWQ